MKNTKIFVGNLDYSVTNEDLEELFSTIGEVIDVDVIKNKGYAFLILDSEESVEKAFENLTDYNLNGRPITIELPKNSRKKFRGKRFNTKENINNNPNKKKKNRR